MKNIKLYERVTNLVEKYYKIIFFAILMLAIVLNTYRLGEVPRGVHVDEAGMTYDAYCIANYGVDRFLKHLPVYFINFGGGQNALYTYLAAIVIKIVGFYNDTIIRIPALILSVIEVIMAYFLVKEFKGRKQGLLFMFLVTIMPWHIMKSRWGLESYLLSPMLLFSIYSLVKAVKSGKLWTYALSGLIFGITLYTYALSYIVIPLFLLLTLIYLLIKKKVKLKQIIVFCIPLMILAIPLILMLMVQKGWIGEIDGFITIPKLHKSRLSEIDITKFLYNVRNLKYVFVTPLIDYNGIEGFGPLYPLGTILMCIGLIITIVKIIKNSNQVSKNKIEKSEEIDLSIIMLFAFISNFILCYLTELNINKANGIYISATYFIFVTLMSIKKNAKTIFTIITLTLIIYFVMFIKEYFTTFANKDYRFFDNGSIEVLEYVYSTDLKDRKICTDMNYIYSLYAKPISPYQFTKNIKIIKVSNGIEVIGYDNYINEINLSKLEDDAVYITEKTNVADKIEQAGFKKEQYKQHYILYK